MNMNWIDVFAGEVWIGDYVFSRQEGAYSLLVGQVTEVHRLGSLLHNDDNQTHDIHINFKAIEYPKWHQDKIAERLQQCFGNADLMAYDELPLDDVVMAPDMLVSLNGVSEKLLEELVEGDIAEVFGRVVDREYESIDLTEKITWLIQRLNDNYKAYRSHVLRLEPSRIIDEAGMISAVVDTHCYLTERHEFDDDEADYLLLFENPLEIVAQEWYDHISQLEDLPYALEHIIERQDAQESGYALIVEESPETSAEGAEEE